MASVDRFVREAECRQISGLSRSMRYELERAGRFPSHVKLTGERVVGWRLSDLMRWMNQRVAATKEGR